MLLLERISDFFVLSSLVLLRCINDKKPCLKKKKSGELMQVVYFVRIFIFCGLSFLSKNYTCCIQREVPLLDFRK